MATVLHVYPGHGGAGASLLAAGLAWVISAHRATVLVDVDPASGGVDLLFGCADAPGVRWPALAAIGWPLDGPSLVGALPRCAELSLLTCERSVPHRLPAALIAEVVDALTRAGCAVVVDHATAHPVDPPGGHSLIVTATEARSVAACARRITARPPAGSGGSLRQLVTRGLPHGGPTPEVVADVLGLPLLAHLPFDRRLPGQLTDDGVPSLGRRSPLLRTARRIADLLGCDGAGDGRLTA